MLNSMTKIQICYAHNGTVGFNFHHSLFSVQNKYKNLFAGNEMSTSAGTLQLIEARNSLVDYFLSHTSPDKSHHNYASHLWFIDTDMGFAPETIVKLVEADKPIVGALCYGLKSIKHDGLGGYVSQKFTTTYDLVKDEKTGLIHFTYKPINNITKKDKLSSENSNEKSKDNDELHQVHGTGVACLLVQRAVLEKMQQEYGKQWFNQVGQLTEDSGRTHMLSEDLSFCYRAITLGYPIFVHSGAKTNHAKTIWVSEDLELKNY